MHKPDVSKIGKVQVINPREACGYLTGERTIAIFDTEGMNAEVIEFR
jgi:predicted phosphodiesterase